MTKDELIKSICSKTGESAVTVNSIYSAIFDEIRSSVLADKKYQIQKFGTFSVEQRDERTGRNPRTGESITIPAQGIVKFTPSQELKDAVKTA